MATDLAAVVLGGEEGSSWPGFQFKRLLFSLVKFVQFRNLFCEAAVYNDLCPTISVWRMAGLLIVHTTITELRFLKDLSYENKTNKHAGMQTNCSTPTTIPYNFSYNSKHNPPQRKTKSDCEKLGLMMLWAPNFDRCVLPRYMVRVTGCLQKYLLQKPHQLSVSMANLCTEIPWRLGYSLGVVPWVRFWSHSRFCDPASIHLQWIPIPIGHPAGTSAGFCVKTSPYFCWNVHP